MVRAQAMHLGCSACRLSSGALREEEGWQLGLAWELQVGLLVVGPLGLIFVSWCWALVLAPNTQQKWAWGLNWAWALGPIEIK